MTIQKTSLAEVLIVEPRVHGDARGYFLESYSQERYRQSGIPCTFVQDNISHSARSVLRGLHFQFPRMQDKLVYVLEGEILDVAVDIRTGSPDFGRLVSVRLSSADHRQLFVPKGFAHGFLVLSEQATIGYKCSDYYVPSEERGVLWNDPVLGIDWGISDPVLSERDRQHGCLNAIHENNLPRYIDRVAG